MGLPARTCCKRCGRTLSRYWNRRWLCCRSDSQRYSRYPACSRQDRRASQPRPVLGIDDGLELSSSSPHKNEFLSLPRLRVWIGLRSTRYNTTSRARIWRHGSNCALWHSSALHDTSTWYNTLRHSTSRSYAAHGKNSRVGVELPRLLNNGAGGLHPDHILELGAHNREGIVTHGWMTFVQPCDEILFPLLGDIGVARSGKSSFNELVIEHRGTGMAGSLVVFRGPEILFRLLCSDGELGSGEFVRHLRVLRQLGDSRLGHMDQLQSFRTFAAIINSPA